MSTTSSNRRARLVALASKTVRQVKEDAQERERLLAAKINTATAEAPVSSEQAREQLEEF